MLERCVMFLLRVYLSALCAQTADCQTHDEGVRNQQCRQHFIPDFFLFSPAVSQYKRTKKLCLGYKQTNDLFDKDS